MATCPARAVDCHYNPLAQWWLRASVFCRRPLAPTGGLPSACGGSRPPQLAAACHHCQEADLLPTVAASFRRPLPTAGEPAAACCDSRSLLGWHVSTAVCRRCQNQTYCPGWLPPVGGPKLLMVSQQPLAAVTCCHCQEADQLSREAASCRRPLAAAGRPATICNGAWSF